jgi:cytochrome c55X
MKVVLFALTFSVGAIAATPDNQRQQELLNLLKHDCGSCHGLTLQGGLGPALLADSLAGKDDASLLHTILNGRPGTPMPPWRDFLNESEVIWLLDYMRQQRPFR